MIFDEESASDAQTFLAPPKRRTLDKKKLTPTFSQKKSQNFRDFERILQNFAEMF